MGKINSRAKGKQGELEWRDFLKNVLGIEARRGQQFSGSTESPDVVSGLEGSHWEVKRVEHLNIHDAVAQAVKDSVKKELLPIVAHRPNKKEWLLTIRAKDLWKLHEILNKHKTKADEFGMEEY